MNKELLATLLKISEKTSMLLIAEGVKDYAMYKGIAMRDSSLPKDARVHLPFCLIPTEFPRQWFEYVHNLQTSMNLVLHKIAHSKEILKECLRGTIETDKFIRSIFNIFEAVFECQSQQVSLGIIRSDYLLNCDESGNISGIKQVENNTIAVGFIGVSSMLRDLYRYVLQRIQYKKYYDLPEHNSCEEIAKAMLTAWSMYGKQDAVFLFIVEESTFNIYDQRFLEYKILEFDRHREVLRYSFKDLRGGCLKMIDSTLYVYGREVAVVYYRVGYSPDHYEPEDWTTRALIEASKAIKCPSVGLHLAGTKKVQMYLTKEGVLEKFVDHKTAEELRKVFAIQYSLDEANENVISNALQHPDSFVLKPEREGGGNNIYGSNIKNFLESDDLSKKSYILMERINPPTVPNYIIRSNSQPQPCKVHSELGIYGVILGNKDCICRNETVGHLLRSKSSKLNEGGIASGCGALDYPLLL